MEVIEYGSNEANLSILVDNNKLGIDNEFVIYEVHLNETDNTQWWKQLKKFSRVVAYVLT